MREPTMNTVGRREFNASDIRVPKSLSECELALELVRDRLASIEADLETKDGSTFPSIEAFDAWSEKAERARSVWAAKEKELLYSKQVLSSAENPELIRLQSRVLSLVGEIHRSTARLAQLAEGVTLPTPLRQFIDARKAQLPAGFYEDYLRQWEAGPCG